MRALVVVFLLGGLGTISGLRGQGVSPDSLFNQALENTRTGNYEASSQLFGDAAEGYLKEGDSLNWASSVLRKSGSLIEQGRVREALDLALRVEQQKPADATIKLKAQIGHYIGWAYRLLEQYDISKEYYLEGIKYAEASGDSVLIGLLNHNISYPYLYTGDYDKALSHQLKAKEIWEKLGYTNNLSNVLNGIFQTYNELGLHRQAEKYIRQSLDIRKTAGNLHALDVAYHNMALNNRERGKVDSAIINYQKSLAISRKLENPYDITQTLLNIGRLYELSSDYENALLYFNEALTFNRQTGRPASIANNLSMIAEIATIQEEYNRAESLYNDALKLLEGTNRVKIEIYVNLELGNLKMLQKQFQLAEEYISKGLTLANECGVFSSRIKGHKLLGDLFKAKGNYRRSLHEYKKAYRIYTESGNPSNVVHLMNIARAYFEIDSDSAFIFAEKAFSRIDSLRTNVSGLTFRAGLFEEFASFFNEVAYWYLEKNEDSEKAFELVEAAKSRVLMDELAEAENKLYQKLDESILIEKQQILKRIDQKYNQVKKAGSIQEREALQNELKDLEFQYETLLNEMRQRVPEWKDFEYPRPLTADGVRELIDEDVAILEFAFSGDHLLRFYITKGGIDAKILNATEKQSMEDHLILLIRNFREMITRQEPVTELQNVSRELVELLIPENLYTESGVSQLVIIPEGILSFLPFEAVGDGQQYLIEKFNIKYLPSASIYPLIHAPHRETSFDLLAVAGSGFDQSENEEVHRSSQGAFASLPATLLEVDSIASNFSNTKILKNEEVTEATIKSIDLSAFRYIHFATHGVIDEVNPSQSGLVLSGKQEVEFSFSEDGHLNSTEIAGLNLNSDLVTLSACNTGVGKVITGEGLLGLQRSFLTAGSSAVIVSLWNVYDRSTAVFMSHFYKQLLSHKEQDYGVWSRSLEWFGMYEHPMFDYKAKALREAKLAMIDHPYYSHPSHWAAFILIGK